ncbi:MAG: hypothetical protein HLX52_07740 [Idiomarinaceae bacterium]|uniref:Uncharacterized conserved membrane protein n=1 Tax=Idiomarina loihiensis (strain ATCC BAA-735 / DSM 15497 / L2-TR) TaxID=283942 RepID=Q5QYZ9_IDILO|nr:MULTISPECIES: hypothetical protein [Idiomarina]AAV82148.1 Uncharacterized conserved membrane protein [Idiomarina loihiensis L2TR]AGM36178.1 hypothetical protein K734_06575 [Idiomarina loihiensis GSL 199]MBL4857123.1 hypothetical protein [Idiomarina sp.]NWO02828.1 hypothetical protein [Idiomarinaceae bacterium]
MDDNKVIIGGSLVESLKGNYQLSLRQIFEQAFNITKSNLTPLIGGFLVLLATAFLMVQALMNVFSVEEIMGSIKIQYISNILGSVLIAPLLGGLILMGIKHSVGIKTKVGDVFNGFNVMMPLIAVALVSTTLKLVAGQLLGLIHPNFMIIAQLYVTAILVLAMPLVIERGVGPLNALYYSIKIIHFKLPKFILLFLVMFGLLLLAFIPLGLGLIWVLPMICNLIGVVYREVIGVTVIEKPKKDSSSENISA